jgi:hypothetical protein
MVSNSQSSSGEYYATNTSKNMPFWKKAVKS